MFPETFARKWIEALTRRGDVVLDPFAGRGTAPFEALLLGRFGVGGDINPVAACLNRAKLAAPAQSSLLRRIGELRSGFEADRWAKQAASASEFFQYAYHPNTLAQLLYLRSTLNWQARRVDAMISALLLGALHGEAKSDRYLSNQMPRTISTKPNYSVKFCVARSMVAPNRDAFEVLRRAVKYRYASELPQQYGQAYFGDIRDLPRSWTQSAPKLIVTSPPYRAVTSYEEDQWLRLWFLKGPDHPSKSRISRDDRYTRPADYWNFIGDFWRVASTLLARDGHVVLRIGATGVGVDELRKQLIGSIVFSPRPTSVVSIAHSEIRRRQTDSFRPGSRGCVYEVDMHVRMT